MSTLEPDKKLLNSDKEIYTQYYHKITSHYCSNINDFSKIINENEFNLVHLIVNIDKDGVVNHIEDNQVEFKSLMKTLAIPSVKFVLIGSSNPSEAYIKEVNPNLISASIMMTLDRKGDNFVKFYSKIFEGMNMGKLLPEIWVELAPQNPDLSHENSPESIMALGRENVFLK